MVYKKRYRHQFQNVEGKNIITMIDDTESGLANPYNITIETIDVGGGDVLIRIFFNNLPAGATGLIFSYSADGGSTWTVVSGTDMVSPKEFTLPNTTQYLYRMVITFPDSSGNILVELSEQIPTIIDLQAAGDPFHLISNNSSRLKHGIFGLQAVIKFLSSSQVNIKTFLEGTYNDRRYAVTSYVDDEEFVFFRGFLAMSESQDTFLPHPNTVVLTATDGLGFLKNIPLTDFTGITPENEQRIIDFIAWCLSKTGIEQTINVIMNIREEADGTLTDEPNNHFYVTQYLDTKTFEDEPGECESCYTVLEKILGKCCVLGQRHGNWWIKNTDEYDNHPDYVAEFNYDGTLLGMQDGAFYTKHISITDPSFFSQERETVSFYNPNRFGKLNYKFQTPKEVPANIEFTRGALIGVIDANSKKFELDDWDKLWSSPTGDLPANANIYVRRNYVNGYEKELFLVIEAYPGEFSFVMSQQIPVQVADKFILDVQKRLNADPGGSGFSRDIGVQVRLYADDGTFYTHHGANSVSQREWVECDADFLTNQKHFFFEYDASEDMTLPLSLYDGESLPVPKSGYLKILLFADPGYLDSYDTYLTCRFEYLPFINGSYQKYSSVGHKISQAANNNESYDEELSVCDGVKPLFKGALKKLVAGKYVMSGRYWNAAVFDSGVPSDDYYHPYGYIVAFNLWNQRRSVQRIFTGTVQGIGTDQLDDLGRIDLMTVFHTYLLGDADDHTNNKKFMLLDYDMDLKLCELASHTLAEVFDTVKGKKYADTDTYDFKFLTS